ncbi:diguanylate cyclase domain-containing protein [Vibrio variabilis]|uniref:diguanylate cyclase domain-containing protein n=1 Tax=Vibrio variabilis TaxID=990271 RepID=UPI000DD69B9D|nr:diguanylate cyclase [Vibrio variabilis]
MLKSIINKIPINVAKLILVALTSLVLMVNLFTIDRINSINTDLSERKNEATWFVLQLVKEYSNLITQVSITPYDEANVSLAYDLTWSRFDIILTSKESSRFIAQANYRLFFEQQFEKFQSLEKSLQLTAIQPDLRQPLLKRIQLNFDQIIRFINDKFRIENPISEQYRSELEQLLTLQKASSITLVVLVAFISYVFWLDASLRKKIHRTDALTGALNRASLNEDIKDQSSWSSYELLSIRVHNVLEVNQRYGIDYGDVIIKATARRIMSIVDPTYRVYRYSGAQFIVLHRKSNKSSGKNHLRELKSALSQPVDLSDMALVLDVSVIYDPDLENDHLLERLTQLSRRPLETDLI